MFRFSKLGVASACVFAMASLTQGCASTSGAKKEQASHTVSKGKLAKAKKAKENQSFALSDDSKDFDSGILVKGARARGAESDY